MTNGPDAERETKSRTDDEYDVAVVGGGVAGLSASTFTARDGLSTLVLDAGESILRRNAHLENFPGFPAGVNARLLLEMLGDQAETAGADRQTATVETVETSDTDEPSESDGHGFVVETVDGQRYRSQYVIAATKNITDYLDGIEGVGIVDRGKSYVDTDERGRTGVDGLYAAGRLAEKPHQAIVCAGHGAEVAVTLLEDADRGFYHDWVAPEGYFSDRDREVPPGCEEIDAAEREQREAASLDAMSEYFAEPHPDEQETHPSLREESE
ncbi:FAD-binding protein [Halosimplex salinum]|uniref:FAD-binding protein n=1 Tax=Halosimplex salinum TaxID=1710538 RepID=UPI000F48E577|nr:FAD-binding protein [Halosimplex salinum]